MLHVSVLMNLLVLPIIHGIPILSQSPHHPKLPFPVLNISQRPSSPMMSSIYHPLHTGKGPLALLLVLLSLSPSTPFPPQLCLRIALICLRGRIKMKHDAVSKTLEQDSWDIRSWVHHSLPVWLEKKHYFLWNPSSTGVNSNPPHKLSLKAFSTEFPLL